MKNLKPNIKEKILYLIIGILTTIINIYLFKFLIYIFNLDIYISNLIDWIVVILLSFLLQKHIVFNDNSNNTFQFLNFIILRLFTLIVEYIIIFIGINIFKINELYIKYIAIFLVICVNYIVSKIFIFNKGEN